jgi:ABC-2 type transport system ATP-binding protein
VTRRAVALVALAAALLAYAGVWGLGRWRDPGPVAPGLLAQPPGGVPAALGPADATAPTDPTPVAPVAPAVPGATVRLLEVAVPTAPSDPTRIVLDAALALPDDADAAAPVPAVVLLHGFGGDRTSLAGRAAELVDAGYAVLLPSARGSGASGGTITLADRDREGRDVAALVDVLAAEPGIVLDAPGDPRVALAGLSYGGGIALVAAGLDPRVDAAVAVATWHDLADALAPDAAAVGTTGTGPLKVGWTSVLFASRSLPGLADADELALGRCGRFDPAVCDLADRAAVAGRLDAAGRARLAAADVTGPLPPTLLVQGVGDTLFGVGQALANARVAAAGGAPVRLRLVQGEHGQASAAIAEGDAARDVEAWLDRWLRGGTDARASDGVVVHDLAGTTRSLALAAPEGARTWSFDAGAVDVVAPAGGLPAALTTFPGLGAVGELADLFGALDVPGQYADLTTEPLADELLLLGGGEVTFGVSSTSGEAQLFLRLAEVAPGGGAELIGTQVAPARLTGLPTDPAAAARITLRIPPVAHLVDEGSRLRLTLATTDQGFANLREPATITLDLDDAGMTLRGPGFAAGVVPAAASAGPSAPPVAFAVPGLAVLGATAVGLAGTLRRRRRAPLAPRAERLTLAAAGPAPVTVRGLTKVYDDGTRAVDGLDLTVAPGQVVGLLGPNGAGKTSALRMLLGLMAPTSGSVALFGTEVRPGHPVLERVGALVAGPGLAPDLSGRDNLQLFWRAGGRPMAAADLPWALEVADLGAAIDRPVRTYSHGMRQRLAIAQALLGRPELLVLDEPTDGLDPEQIRRMRRLLARLGAEGHAVLVSSHLLAEVEQTCTHAVVMDAGRAVAAGTVAELGERARTLVVEVDDRDRAGALLGARYGTDRVELEGAGLAVALADPAEAADVVAALVAGGLRVTSASRRGRLEDVFLELTGHAGGRDGGHAGGGAS